MQRSESSVQKTPAGAIPAGVFVFGLVFRERAVLRLAGAGDFSSESATRKKGVRLLCDLLAMQTTYQPNPQLGSACEGLIIGWASCLVGLCGDDDDV